MPLQQPAPTASAGSAPIPFAMAVVIGVIVGLVTVCTCIALVIALLPCHRRRQTRLKAGVSDLDVFLTTIGSLFGRAGSVAGRVMPSTQEQLNYGKVEAKPKARVADRAPTSSALVVAPNRATASTVLVVAVPDDAGPPSIVDRPPTPKRVIVRNGVEHQHPAETTERLDQWLSFAEAESKKDTPKSGFQARIRPPSATSSAAGTLPSGSAKPRLAFDDGSSSAMSGSRSCVGPGSDAIAQRQRHRQAHSARPAGGK